VTSSLRETLAEGLAESGDLYIPAGLTDLNRRLDEAAYRDLQEGRRELRPPEDGRRCSRCAHAQVQPRAEPTCAKTGQHLFSWRACPKWQRRHEMDDGCRAYHTLEEA